MPFEIVRNDITNMQTDAIVNTANPEPLVGYGVDAGIHKKAGRKLLKARKKAGYINVGEAAITPGFKLDAPYVIHAVCPVWQGGEHNEEKLLRQCYDSSLKLAYENNCESVAFPLLSAGNHGFPKPLALQIAVNAFSSFLMEHEMQIYLVVFSRDAFSLSEKLFNSVKSYIDENYIFNQTLAEYGITDKCDARKTEINRIIKAIKEERNMNRNSAMMMPEAPRVSNAPHPEMPHMDRAATPQEESQPDDTCIIHARSAYAPNELESMLKRTDAGFSETLLKLIDKTGKKDSEIYKKANIDRKLFSKIRNNADYKPSKATALAFAIALELNLNETRDFIARAGFALSHSSKFDIIIEYFISNGKYDMFEINETLFAFDQTLLGA